MNKIEKTQHRALQFFYNEQKMSSKHVVKVRKFLGATIDDMHHYMMPLLEKQPDNVNLHVGTNDASSCNSSEIVNNISKL